MLHSASLINGSTFENRSKLSLRVCKQGLESDVMVSGLKELQTVDFTTKLYWIILFSLHQAVAAPGCSQLEGRKNDHRAAATVSTFSAGGSAAAGTNLQRTCVSIFEKNKTKKTPCRIWAMQSLFEHHLGLRGMLRRRRRGWRSRLCVAGSLKHCCLRMLTPAQATAAIHKKKLVTFNQSLLSTSAWETSLGATSWLPGDTWTFVELCLFLLQSCEVWT